MEGNAILCFQDVRPSKNLKTAGNLNHVCFELKRKQIGWQRAEGLVRLAIAS